jgi:glycosyltransferase involved in cell wall biosynthesis
MRICLIEPFYSGSHKRWADELASRSGHEIDILSLPGRHWKWRMHGAAITLARQFAARNQVYDAILASDMLDLTVFLSLLRRECANTPVALYFHENQLLYPWSPRDADTKNGRDLHYAFINYSSALAADKLYFNSNYHREAFLAALPEFLARYPDFENKETVAQLEAKSETLWLGMDLQAYDAHRVENRGVHSERPLFVWNHRWEYDKNPIGFFRILYQLMDRGIEFDLALLGESFEEAPPYFVEAKERLGDRIAHYGIVAQFADYANWLWQADIALVTSSQDFFGGSVVEAMFCGCHPILPNRLAYPDHIDVSENQSNFFESEAEAVDLLARWIETNAWKKPSTLGEAVKRYDWSNQIERYDKELEALGCRARPHSTP